MCNVCMLISFMDKELVNLLGISVFFLDAFVNNQPVDHTTTPQCIKGCTGNESVLMSQSQSPGTCRHLRDNNLKVCFP